MGDEYNECCGSKGPHKMSCSHGEDLQVVLPAYSQGDGKLVVDFRSPEMGQYTRKYKAVKAMRLTVENLDSVHAWSSGKLTAKKQSYPPIRVDSAEMSAYAMPDWWLLLCIDGSFEVVHDAHFKRDYEEQLIANQIEPCEGSDT